MEMDRRKFMEIAISSLAINLIYDILKPYVFLAANGTKTTILDHFVNPNITENTQLFSRYLNIENVIQIYPGEGNILAAAIMGEHKPSRYISGACDSFAGFLPKREDYVKVVREHPELELRNDRDILHLGGPVANIFGGKFTGYTYEWRDGKPFPILVGNTRFRWGYDVGQNNFGDRGETLRNEDGVAKPKPRYALIDNKSRDRLIFPRVDEQGRSLDDWLLLTRIPNVYSDSSKSILSIGGMHGHSLEAFTKDLYSSFNHLESHVRFSELSKNFQILLPCRLVHSTDDQGAQKTRAVILWENYNYEPI